jgi:hypothetical protein
MILLSTHPQDVIDGGEITERMERAEAVLGPDIIQVQREETEDLPEEFQPTWTANGRQGEGVVSLNPA